MDNAILKKIVSYIILCSIFVTGGMLHVGFTIEWYYFLYLAFSLVCLILYRRFNILFGLLLIILFAGSLMTYQTGIALVWKQLFNVSFSVFVFYNFLIWEDWNYDSIFTKYVNLCKIVLVIGFFQVFIFAVDSYGGPLRSIYFSVFPFLRETNISARFQSVTMEPSFIAFTFAPIVFLSFYNLTRRSTYVISTIWSLLFILGYIVTLSVVAFMGILVMLLILYFKNFTVQKLSVSIIVFVVLGAIGGIMYRAVPPVRLRIDDTLFGFTNDFNEPQVYRHVNLTTYALLSNWEVTKSSFQEHPLVGTGIGTYQIAYDRLLPEDMQEYSTLNREDAGGLAMRILTETGCIGFFLFLMFVFRFRIRSRPSFSDAQEFLWIMNAGIFVMIILFLIRSGHYTYQARILFFMLYYFTYKAVSK